jgi:methylenetetrahydrofolate--tRNA-(uracil-5-)-methyltransferase
MNHKKVIILGGGLAGVEAAYQIAKRNIDVELYEMRPRTQTGAHSTDFLGELICSNSLGSTQITSASGLLKEESTLLDSFYLAVAKNCRVPAGSSFSVDRIKLAEDITAEIKSISNIELFREEVLEIPKADCPVIICTGPLTSNGFAQSISDFTMRKNLFFYDATSPIIAADSIDFNKMYKASRYNKGTADFLNIPLDEDQYSEFVNDLVEAEKVEVKPLEEKIFYDACLPIEEIARRGEKTLSFGPLKPVGLINPKTDDIPYAVIQLRQDDLKENFYQLVGFQTRLKWKEQKRIFRKLPGLEKAQFERYGRMHRNTYINAPLLMNKYYQSKLNKNIYFAGQICGVEGYVESINSGLMAGIFTSKAVLKETIYSLPENTASGALVNYVSQANWKEFTPTKFTFGLLPSPKLNKRPRRESKKMKKNQKANEALNSLATWIKKANI